MLTLIPTYWIKHLPAFKIRNIKVLQVLYLLIAFGNIPGILFDPCYYVVLFPVTSQSPFLRNFHIHELQFFFFLFPKVNEYKRNQNDTLLLRRQTQKVFESLRQGVVNIILWFIYTCLSFFLLLFSSQWLSILSLWQSFSLNLWKWKTNLFGPVSRLFLSSQRLSIFALGHISA